MACITAYGALVEGAPVAKGDHVLLLAASGGVGLAVIEVANRIGASRSRRSARPTRSSASLSPAPRM
ncbi:hypothetical protein AB0L10_38835 [Streptomyces flaveolus]|uniref:hypothetical protein n=1 Tax=Streptomyces flaveolus TaxID=67297 RepID=UPI00343641EE